MTKNNLPIRYLTTVQRSLSTPAGAATIRATLNCDHLDDVFRLPSPEKEREFVRRVLEQECLTKYAA